MNKITKIMKAVDEAVSYYRHSVSNLKDIHAIGEILQEAGTALKKLNQKDFKDEYG